MLRNIKKPKFLIFGGSKNKKFLHNLRKSTADEKKKRKKQGTDKYMYRKLIHLVFPVEDKTLCLLRNRKTQQLGLILPWKTPPNVTWDVFSQRRFYPEKLQQMLHEKIPSHRQRRYKLNSCFLTSFKVLLSVKRNQTKAHKANSRPCLTTRSIYLQSGNSEKS